MVAGNSIYNYPSEYWAYYQNYACRPGFAIVYRNLNYGKRPPPGQSGFYPGYGANTFNPYNGPRLQQSQEASTSARIPMPGTIPNASRLKDRR